MSKIYKIIYCFIYLVLLAVPVYSQCTNPDAPIVSSALNPICSGSSNTLSIISGALNDATNWVWYTSNCGGTPAGIGATINVSPLVTTTYYVRGEGGCVTPGSCTAFTLNVNPIPDVNQVQNLVVCNNASIPSTIFTSSVSGTIFTWTNSNLGFGLPASGTGNIIAFAASNTTNAPIVDTITVTPSTPAQIGSTTFNFTGTVQSWTVPQGITSISVDVYGAQGSSGGANGNQPGGTGGLGAELSGTLAVTPGQVLNIYVGGTNGYNGGGNPGLPGLGVGGTPVYPSGTGGGATDIRIGGALLSNRVVIAAGGGGGAGAPQGTCLSGAGGSGGAGGILTGANGTTGAGCGPGGQYGSGASQINGGTGGGGNSNCSGSSYAGLNGVLGMGGNGGNGTIGCSGYTGSGGGGGGGGYYGGGGAGGGNGGGGGAWAGGGGGGGSSYTGSLINPVQITGSRNGDGMLTISYSNVQSCTGNSKTSTITINPSPTGSCTPTSQTICSGNSITPIVNTGNISGTAYNWTRNNTATVTGISPSGIGTITGALINTGSVPATVTFTITPVFNNGGVSCVGNSFTATVLVTPAFSLAAAVTPLYPMAGQQVQTVYVNYPASAQSETITVTPNGGTPPYTYSWSKSSCNGAASTLSPWLNSGNTYTFSPTINDVCSGNNSNVYMFSITARDSNNCLSIPVIKKLNVVNPYVGSNLQVCHSVAVRGASSSQLLMVTPAQLALHLAHGDELGNCQIFTGSRLASPQVNQDGHFAILYPNPTSGVFILELSSILEQAFITVTDVQGRVLVQRNLAKNDEPTATFDLSNYSAGMYLVEVHDGDFSYRTKLVVQ